MTRSLSLLVSMFVLGSGAAVGQITQPCTEIIWQPFQTYTVKSALHHRTHIILPEPIQGKPVPGSPQLWDVVGENVHLFIKPKNFGNVEGGQTTVTAVSTSNRSYDFIVKRVKKGADICIRIVEDSFSGFESSNGSQTQGWRYKEERQNEQLRQQLSYTKKQVRAERQKGRERTLDALHEYRNNIYTRYRWKGGSKRFNTNEISDIWDDGRWTYIRLEQDNKGLMQVTAVVDGKEELLQYDYDASRQIYTMAGLYPKFTLRYSRSKITVTRLDDDTNGAY